MSTSDTRRKWRRKVNERGFMVIGLNGESRRGVIAGSAKSSESSMNRRKFAKVYVADDFAPFMFPISWGTVKAMADGYVTDLRIRPNAGVDGLLRGAKGAVAP